MSARYTVRNASDDILAGFDTEQEAIEYGSHLADAEPDDGPYSVVGIVGLPDDRRQRDMTRASARISDRRRRLLVAVDQLSASGTSELAHEIGENPSTVRSDLLVLEETGKVIGTPHEEDRGRVVYWSAVARESGEQAQRATDERLEELEHEKRYDQSQDELHGGDELDD